jgi:hypothetical protein
LATRGIGKWVGLFLATKRKYCRIRLTGYKGDNTGRYLHRKRIAIDEPVLAYLRNKGVNNFKRRGKRKVDAQ